MKRSGVPPFVPHALRGMKRRYDVHVKPSPKSEQCLQMMCRDVAPFVPHVLSGMLRLYGS
jgi:hypothetical protein